MTAVAGSADEDSTGGDSPVTGLPAGFGALLDGAFDVHVHGQPDLAPSLQNRGEDLAVLRLARAYGRLGAQVASVAHHGPGGHASAGGPRPGLHRVREHHAEPADGRRVHRGGRARGRARRAGRVPARLGLGRRRGRGGYIAQLLGEISPSFPGYAAKNAISLLTPSGGLSGKCREVIDACLSLGFALATGHASLAESQAVAEYCASVSQRLLVTHPLHYTRDPTELREFTDRGAFVEFCNAPLIHPDAHLSVRDVHEVMAALGPDRIVLSTDAFSRWAPPEPECLRIFTEQLAYLGWPPGQLRQMTAANPRAFLGITPPEDPKEGTV